MVFFCQMHCFSSEQFLSIFILIKRVVQFGWGEQILQMFVQMNRTLWHFMLLSMSEGIVVSDILLVGNVQKIPPFHKLTHASWNQPKELCIYASRPCYFPFLYHRRKNKEHGFFSPWMLTKMTPPNRYTLWHIDRYRWQVPMAILSKPCWTVSLIKGAVTSWMVHTTPCWVIAWWSWESPIERWWSGSLGGRFGCFWWNRFLLENKFSPRKSLWFVHFWMGFFFFLGGAFFEKLEEGCS